MQYKDQISEIASHVRPELIDFKASRAKGKMPSLVSSEFLTNKEQGDWAENTLFSAINSSSKNIIAVRYGKNDNISAGDAGFKEFFEQYQNELDTIGKRPDLLLFEKKDFPYETLDISGFDQNDLDQIVPKAKCGIEVRSSSYLVDQHVRDAKSERKQAADEIFRIQEIIRTNYNDILRQKDPVLFDTVMRINNDNMHEIEYRCRNWKSTNELQQLSGYLKEIKKHLNDLAKRQFLSITPKVEDLRVVYTWIQKYNVPHYYVQVFFDKAYGISFQKILSLIADDEKEGQEYFIDRDPKNQRKPTIKINACNEICILDKIALPEHYSEMKTLNKGRLLFYVRFKESNAVINQDGFKDLFKVTLE